MQNPYNNDADANKALIDGQSARAALGFPSQNAQAGLRTPQRIMADARERLNATAAEVAPRPQPAPNDPVVGVNPQTKELFSAGKQVSYQNLTVLDQAAQAGYLDYDNTDNLPDGFVPVRASQVRAYLANTGGKRGAMSAAGEVGKQLLSGIADIPQMGVRAAQFAAPSGSWLEGQLRQAGDDYDTSTQGSTPDTFGRGEVASALIKGGRSIAPSVAAGSAMLAAPVVGTAAAGATFFGSQATDTYESGLQAGLSPEAARSAAIKTGAIEAGGELVADRLGLGLMRGAGTAFKQLGTAPLSHGKNVAVDLLANAGLQAGTEFGQSYGQAAVEQNAGISDQDPFAAGMEGAKTGLGMAALMAPFGAAVGFSNRPRDLLEPAPVQEAPAPSTAVAPYVPTGIPTPVQDVTPESMYGFGYGGPALLPAPAAPARDANTIYVTPGGTAAGDTSAFTGLQPDMFGGQDTFGEAPAATQPEAAAPMQDAATPDMFDDALVANVNVDFGASALARELAGTGKRSNAVEFLARDLSAALGTPAAADIVERINNSSRWKGRNLPTDVVERANEILSRYDARQQDAQGQEQMMRTNQWAAEGQAKAQPGAVVGQRPDVGPSAQIALEESAARQAPAAIPMADQITDVDAAADARRTQDSAAERRQILDRILADPTTSNPAGRFTATLKKLGYRDTKVSAEEAAAMRRHDEITAALAEDDVISTPNEMDVESLVPERKPKPAQPVPRRQNPQLAQEFELTSYSADDLTALDAAKQKRERKETPVAAADTDEAPAGQQGKLWDKAGRVTAGANVNKAKGPMPTPDPAPLPPKRAKLNLPKDQAKASDLTGGVQEAPAEKPPVTNADVQQPTETVEHDASRLRVAKAIEDAYEADQIDMDQYAELGAAYNDAKVSGPALRAMLHRMAVQSVGASRAKFRTAATASGMKAADVQQLVRRIVDKWTNAPEIVVVQSQKDLPESIRKDIEDADVDGIKGAFSGGKVYIVADAATDAHDIALTIAHEATGHYGLRGILGDKLSDTMQAVYSSDSAIRAAADAKIAESGGKLDAATATEEVLADAQESGGELPTGRISPNTLRRTVERLVNAIRTALRSFTGQTFTRAEIDELLVQARNYVIDGPKDGGPSGGKTVFRTPREAVSNIVDNLKYDKMGAARRGVLSASFLRDIGERYASKFTRVKEYVDSVFKMGAAAGVMQEEAIKVQDAISGLPRAEREALMDFMGRVTFESVAIEGKPNAAESAKAADLRQEFAGFSPAQQKAYRDARDALAKNWKRRADLLSRTAAEVYDPLIAEATAAGNVKATRALQREKDAYIEDVGARLSQIKGDYFPLMRFGNYAVIRKSDKYAAVEKAADKAFDKLNSLLNTYDKKTPDERKIDAKRNEALRKAGQDAMEAFTPEQNAEIKAARDEFNELSDALENLKASEADYYVAQFETEAQARADQRVNGGYVSLRKEFSKELNPINRQMLNRLEESMAVTMRGKGNVTAMRDAKRAMFEVYLSSLPELSALKRQARRKNVAGWNKDMQRNIAASMLKDSFYLSRMEHMDEMNAALNSVRTEADDMARRGAPDAVKLQEVAAELERRQEASMQYTETPLQDFASAVSYVYFLGVSPGFLFANMMQPFMISAPMLAARHGARTFGAMGKAYADVAAIVTKSLKGNWRGELDFERSDLKADEKAMLHHLLQQRLLSVTLTHDLAATSEGKTGSRFMRAISLPSHHVEVMNRVGTALAAYRMELDRSGGNTVAAMAYAQKVLADTHFDYSTENAPYFMKPGVVPLGKLLFQFKKYQAGMISLYAKIISASLRGESKEVRNEAKLNLLGLLATHSVVAGAMGLPGIGALMFLANTIQKAFGDDEPWDAETALRNWLRDQLGKDAGAAVAKGLPTLAGVDLSAKLGAGNILSIAPMMRDSDTGRGVYTELLLSLAGPTLGGLLPRFADGAQFMNEGQFGRAAESFMPKFAADVLRAGRFADEGVRTRGGDAMRKDVGAWDAFIVAAGLSQTDIADMYAANAAIKSRESFFMDQSRSLQRKWADAKPEDRAEIEAMLRETVNPARLAAGLKPLTRGDLLRYQNQRTRREASYATVGANVSRRAGQQMGEVGRFAKD